MRHPTRFPDCDADTVANAYACTFADFDGPTRGNAHGVAHDYTQSDAIGYPRSDAAYYADGFADAWAYLHAWYHRNADNHAVSDAGPDTCTTTAPDVPNPDSFTASDADRAAHAFAERYADAPIPESWLARYVEGLRIGRDGLRP